LPRVDQLFWQTFKMRRSLLFSDKRSRGNNSRVSWKTISHLNKFLDYIISYRNFNPCLCRKIVRNLPFVKFKKGYLVFYSILKKVTCTYVYLIYYYYYYTYLIYYLIFFEIGSIIIIIFYNYYNLRIRYGTEFFIIPLI